MKPRSLVVQVLLVFVAALLAYALIYRWIEHRRVFKGPWVVTCAGETNAPTLVINQAAPPA